MQKTTAFVVGAAILAVALIGAAFLFTHKPKPEPKPVDLYKQAHAAEIACLQGGGSWVAGKNADGAPIIGGYCEHSQPTTAAPAVTSPSPATSTSPLDEFVCPMGMSFANECVPATNVKRELYNRYGYDLPLSPQGIVKSGHKLCQLLPDGSTDAEVIAAARATAISLNTSQRLGLAVVAQLYANFC